MTNADLLARLLERNQESFLKMVHRVPTEHLDWSPYPGLRSTLNQFQEVATVVGDFWSLYSDRKMNLEPKTFSDWLERRSTMTDIVELETRLRADTARLIEHIRTLSPEDLTLPVQMPLPGEYLAVDTFMYNAWNMAYHEGQIAQILMHLDINPMA